MTPFEIALACYARGLSVADAKAINACWGTSLPTVLERVIELAVFLRDIGASPLLTTLYDNRMSRGELVEMISPEMLDGDWRLNAQGYETLKAAAAKIAAG